MNFRDSEYLLPIFDFDILNLQLNTALFILALVLTVMYFMNRLLFQPVLKTLEEREEFLESLARGAGEQRAEIAQLSENYEQELEKVKVQVAQVRQDARKEAAEPLEAIRYRARQEADLELRAALSELEQEVEAAKGELATAARDLAEKAATRVLGA